ncbi:MAG: hypothetical protein HC836_16930 [Richelia sp. RM2_1_2]|nr:hypothetical protein [Richelia sp. RM2_1_2]
MRYADIYEAGRIGTGIHKKEIPNKFKHLPIIKGGIGTTSIILEKDPETVIMLTKDGIKKDWLVHELKIAEQIGYYDTRHPKLGDMPIYVLEMPRLYPLGPKTRRAARDLIKTFQEIYNKAWAAQKSYAFSKNKQNQAVIDLFYKFFDQYNETNTDEHILSQLVGFLANYNVDQYSWDLRMGNLMQDRDENLIILDPIVDREILDVFTNRR